MVSRTDRPTFSIFNDWASLPVLSNSIQHYEYFVRLTRMCISPWFRFPVFLPTFRGALRVLLSVSPSAGWFGLIQSGSITPKGGHCCKKPDAISITFKNLWPAKHLRATVSSQAHSILSLNPTREKKIEVNHSSEMNDERNANNCER